MGTQLPPELLVMHTVSLLLAFATNILAFEDDFGDIDQGFPPLLNMTDNVCSRSEECIPQGLCPYFQEDVTRLEQLLEESKEYKEMVANMQRYVCNKKEKGFCCSLIETNSIIGGPAQKCCRECRYHHRQRKCVSLRTGRCCPCSNARCGKAARPAARSTTTTTTETRRVPSEAETEPVSILNTRFLTTEEE